MTNLAARTLTVVLGVPAVVCLLILLPWYNHLAFAAFCVICVCIGAFEMDRLLYGRGHGAAVFSGLAPAFTYLDLMFFSPALGLGEVYAAVLALGWMMIRIGRDRQDYTVSLGNCAKVALGVFYPGYLGCFIIRILALETPERSGGWLLLYMLLLVFANDIFAYVFGMLLGKGHGGVVPVSPKKSIQGFAGGALMAVCLSIVLSLTLYEGISPAAAAVLGLGVAISADAGDLLESLFKRSAGVKDSGNCVPGRGGILDCLDSVLATAPLFYLLLEVVL